MEEQRINPTEAKKVHSLIDKICQRKNSEIARERVRANRGSGGIDGQSIRAFAEQADEQLNRLQGELKEQSYPIGRLLTHSASTYAGREPFSLW